VLACIGREFSKNEASAADLAKIKAVILDPSGVQFRGSSFQSPFAASVAAMAILNRASGLIGPEQLTRRYSSIWTDRKRRQELRSVLDILRVESDGRHSMESYPLLLEISEAAASELYPTALSADLELPDAFLVAVARHRLDLAANEMTWLSPRLTDAVLSALSVGAAAGSSGIPGIAEISESVVRAMTQPTVRSSDEDHTGPDGLASERWQHIVETLRAQFGQLAVSHIFDALATREDVGVALNPTAYKSLASFATDAASWLTSHSQVKPRFVALLSTAFDPWDPVWRRTGPEPWRALPLALREPLAEPTLTEIAAFYLALLDNTDTSQTDSASAWHRLFQSAETGEVSLRAWQVWSGSEERSLPPAAEILSEFADAYVATALKEGWSEDRFRRGIPSPALYDYALKRLVARRKEAGAETVVERIVREGARSSDPAVRLFAEFFMPLFPTRQTKPTKRRKRR
jgi:hypothetical protein